MNYLADLQKRLSDGVSEADIAATISFLKENNKKLMTFPCGCHGDRTPEEVIHALESKEDHWEDYVVSILSGIAVTEVIKQSYASKQPMSERLEALLDLTRDFVTAVVKETTEPLFIEQLAAHFSIESSLFREKLVQMEADLEKYRASAPSVKPVVSIN